MSENIHLGDNINMEGNQNIGKVVLSGGDPDRRSTMTGGRHDRHPTWPQPLVFINYRAADDKAATAIHREFTRRLGHGAVFRDSTMPAGTVFPRELTDKASSCAAMIAIIGEHWDADNGLRLLRDPTDWVRREIATALAHGVAVVPVLVGARGRLDPHSLPKDIRTVAYVQGPHLRSGYDEEDVRRLVHGLLSDLPPLAEAAFRNH